MSSVSKFFERRKSGRFCNRSAVVTGGGSGVGAAIALSLAAEGADLCLVGRRVERLEATAGKASALGSNTICYRADLGQQDQLVELTRRILTDMTSVDILVHCAAVIEKAPIEIASLEDFDSHYRVNVRAPYALTQALLPSLKERRGEIVFINSSSGIAAKPLFAQYDATKHALRALADSLRGEVNECGVRVLSIFLGRTASDMQVRLHSRECREYRPELLLQPDDVASVVVSVLALPRSAEVTDIHIRPMIRS
jgi:NADP-dependent 3-hydroxy acid dehydrogenase YdfG